MFCPFRTRSDDGEWLGLIAPRWLAAFLLCGSALCGFAQQTSPLPDAPSVSADTTPSKNTKLETVRTTVTVLGAPDPISLGESARSVVVMDTQQHPLAYNTVEDYLRTDSSVQINQRGSGGYPADLSIRGTSFEQTLVLWMDFASTMRKPRTTIWICRFHSTP